MTNLEMINESKGFSYYSLSKIIIFKNIKISNKIIKYYLKNYFLYFI